MAKTVTTHVYDTDGQDQLLSMEVAPISGPSTTTVFEYDRSTGALKAEGLLGVGGNSPGNVQSPSRSYVWSNDDRLWQVTDVTGGVTTTLAYDPAGRLIMERSSALTEDRLRLWDGWAREGFMVHGGTVRDEFLVPEGWGAAGRKAAGGSFESLTLSPSGHAKDMHADQPTFAPYGELVAGSLHGELGFHSHEWHEDAGLYQMRHRWYEPTSRRLLSRDPIIQQDVGIYALTGLSPILEGDPFGLQTAVIIGAQPSGFSPGGHPMYPADVYLNMTLADVQGCVPCAPSFTIPMGITAQHPHAEGVRRTLPPGASSFGPYLDSPPGTYELSDRIWRPRPTWLSYNTPGQAVGVVLSPDGRRNHMGVHWGHPENSKGCLTSPEMARLRAGFNPPGWVVVPDVGTYGPSPAPPGYVPPAMP